MIEAVQTELTEMGVDTEALQHELAKEAAWRLDKSIDAGRRVAAGQAAASDPREAALIGAD